MKEEKTAHENNKVSIEKAFRGAFYLCIKDFRIFLPIIAKTVLNFFIIIFALMSILLTLGINEASLSFESEQEFLLFLSKLRQSLTPASIFFMIFGISFAFFVMLFINSATNASLINFVKEKIEKEEASLMRGVKKHSMRIFTFYIIMLVLVISAILIIIFSSIISPFLGAFIIFLFMLLLGFLRFLIIFAHQIIVCRERNAAAAIMESISFVLSNLLASIIYVLLNAGITLGIFFAVGFLSTIFDFIFSASAFLRTFFSFFFNIATFLVGILLATYFEAVKTYFVAFNMQENESRKKVIGGDDQS